MAPKQIRAILASTTVALITVMSTDALAAPSRWMSSATAAQEAGGLWLSPYRMRYEHSSVLPAPEESYSLDAEELLASLGVEAERASDSQRDFATVASALLLLRAGHLDLCHNLITPLSWGDETLFGGPPKPGSAAEAAAVYAHVLVHRREGHYPGEFGTGWNNSGFWAGRLGATEAGVRDKVMLEARGLAERMADEQGSTAALRHLEKRHGEQWRPKSFNVLCEAVANDAAGGDEELRRRGREFCEQIAEVEWWCLLHSCVERVMSDSSP